ncbi:MAG: nucleoside-diphosphate sugar epimerase/dehydratase [Pseudomonadota bacterium]
MLFQYKNKNFWIILLADAFLAAACYWGAYLLRFEGNISTPYLASFAQTVWWVIVVKLGCLFILDVYKGMWRYTSIQDLRRIITASVLGSVLVVFILVIFHRFEGFPRSVFIIDFLLFFLTISGFRMAIRMYYQSTDQGFFNYFVREMRGSGKRVIIIGAGDAGEKFLREIRENPRLNYQAVGFVDDAKNKIDRTMHGVSVLGGIDTLVHQAEMTGADELIIAIPSATGKTMRRIVEACEKTGKPYRTLPGLGELINGRVSIKTLRDVSYEDLLGRPQVKLDQQGISEYLKGKSVLVTGAGGSIGSELCRQIARFHPENLILLDMSEPDLYRIQMEFKSVISHQRILPVLGGVQDTLLMDRLFKMHRPAVVFHAAAYKHVPLVEENPWQGVLNNILGTQRMLALSIKYRVGHFVLVSTDKAVRPTNVMGTTKRVCELLVQAYKSAETRMIAVRFGNVFGSAGSVIPLFRKQIERGGPVTVTHPDVTRYFMTIPEATQLILQAGALGLGGEIFILEMGTPVKIADMARDLITLSGKEPDTDIEIRYTGLRPGEKLYEELITQGEGIVPTEHEKIMVLKPEDQFNGNGNAAAFRDRLCERLEGLYDAARRQDGCEIRERLKEIVPEYESQPSECVM